MENKTPMQEAIDKIEVKSKENNSMEFQYGLNFAFRILTELLPKEKQVIEDAGNTCAIQQMILFDKIDKMNSKELEKLANRETITLGQEYYNQKFNKK